MLELQLAETAAVTFQPCLGCQGCVSLILDLEQQLRPRPTACFVLTSMQLHNEFRVSMSQQGLQSHH